MVRVIRARRRSAVLTPSSLACLSVMPTINLTAGCLSVCACKNSDIASGSCNIAGTWRRRPAEASQPVLVRAWARP